MVAAPPANRTWSPAEPDTVAQPREPEYTVRVVGSLAQWTELKEAWNNLLTESRANVVFLTWEWLSTWADCFWGSDRELFVVAVFKGDELVGVAPWCIRRHGSGPFKIRQIEFLGGSDVASDYLDVFASRGKEKEVARRIYDFLFHEGRARWDTLALLDVPANSLFLVHFLDAIAEDGKHVEVEPGGFCPTLRLPRTQSEFMRSLSPHRRAQFMRHQRLLQRYGGVEHSTITPREDTGALDTLYTLYQGKQGAQRVRFHRFLQSFLSRAGDRGWVQIDLLTVGARPVAGLFHLRYGATLFQYLLAANKDACPKTSVGNVLIGLCLQQAITANVAEYDILRGSEEYKFHWATGGRRSLNVRMYQRRLPAVLLVALKSVKAPLKVLLR